MNHEKVIKLLLSDKRIGLFTPRMNGKTYAKKMVEELINEFRTIQPDMTVAIQSQ